jgi:hypothetical protein
MCGGDVVRVSLGVLYYFVAADLSPFFRIHFLPSVGKNKTKRTLLLGTASPIRHKGCLF